MSAIDHTIGHTTTPRELPLGRLLYAYLNETRFEALATLRNKGMTLPFLLLPPVIYLLFGVIINGNVIASQENGQALANYLFCGFSTMAAMMPGMFAGVALAIEREGRLQLLRRALPAPPAANLIAKVLTLAGFASMAALLVAVTSALAGVCDFSASQYFVVWLVLSVGSLPFAAFGLWLGTWTSGSAAPAWANLVFLPMLWLSGLFIPLPEFLERWVLIWPAFHLNQLAIAAAGVEGFQFVPASLAAAVLIAVTTLFGTLAVRRLARVG